MELTKSTSFTIRISEKDLAVIAEARQLGKALSYILIKGAKEVIRESKDKVSKG